MMAPLTIDQLPQKIFDHILFLIGCGSIEKLESCRQVSRTWNRRIMNSLSENPSRKWGQIIGRRFERSWNQNLPTEEQLSKASELEAAGILPVAVMASLVEKLRGKLKGPSLQEIRCAASLAHKGLIGSVDCLRLWEVDLSSVPPQNLSSLVACVTSYVFMSKIFKASSQSKIKSN